MADAYKLKADASFPKALTTDGEGNALDTLGVNYAAGEYVLASDLTKVVLERADNGDLDHLLESVSLDEAQNGQYAVENRVVIAEHEAERVAFEDAEATVVVPRDQAVELNSAGAEQAKAAIEASKEDGGDERPNLTAAEVPSLVDVSQGKELAVAPKDSERVDEELLSGVEQPPGLPVGPDQAEAAGGSTEPKRRERPQRAAAPKAEDKKEEGKE